MKKFICKLVWFTIPIVSLFVLGLLIPTTPRASKSLLFANRQKDELLLHVESPRMIFVGGSNLSFGLNSQMIKEELNLNPINTGVHAGIGIRYMLENTIQYVREGDIIILALEYSHFYHDYNSGSAELLRTIFDVELSNIRLLNLQQIVGLIPHVPKYSLSKFRPSEYFNIKESDVYSVNSFNEYGDVYTHWGLEQRKFLSSSVRGQFNQSVILHILDFQKEIFKKKAILYVTYPGYQDISYLNSIKQIERVAIEYKKNGLVTLGCPERYKMPNHMMFNTTYHLNKEGLDHRSRLFIDDYKRMKLNQARAIFDSRE